MSITPICVMSFNRPDLLDQTLKSMKNQSRSVEGSPIALFQDWSDSESELHKKCISVFKSHFPAGYVFDTQINLGVALNFDRAERWAFEELSADLAYFFEDDMVLSENYISVLDKMAKFALHNEKIAYVAAYGNHRLSLDEQREKSHAIIELDHKWGFALTRRQWLKQKPIIDGYLDIVRKRAYKNRDNIAIRKYFSSLGYSSPGTSQDAAKDVASCVLGTVKINTLVSLAKYIGESGLHSTPEAYAVAGYGKTEIFDDMPALETPSEIFLDTLAENNRNSGKYNLMLHDEMTVNEIPIHSSNEKYVYFGNLFPVEAQYASDLFVGLALEPKFDKDIPHDARSQLPFEDGVVAGFQSQDVFEHVEYDKVSGIFDDIYRCLRTGGRFRLSLPDYNSPVLRSRSAYDFKGKVLYDVSMGGRLVADHGGNLKALLPPGGDTHLWFPTYDLLLGAIINSDIRKCATIEFYHYWKDHHEFVIKDFDQSEMPVMRAPPRDMRANGKPISIIVDFVK